MAKAKAQKKEFGFTDVAETFKCLVDAGMTPEQMKGIRSSPLIALRVLLATSGNISDKLQVAPCAFVSTVEAMMDAAGQCFLCCHGEWTGLYTEIPITYVQWQPLGQQRSWLEPAITCRSSTVDCQNLLNDRGWRLTPATVRDCPTDTQWYVVSRKRTT